MIRSKWLKASSNFAFDITPAGAIHQYIRARGNTGFSTRPLLSGKFPRHHHHHHHDWVVLQEGREYQ